MRVHRFVRIAAVAVCAAAAAAAAETAAGGLAPPGDCAEPRQARGEPVEDELARFPVAGTPRDHFDPRDVAARGADPRDEPPGPPPAPPPFERTACDAPGAVCVGATPRAAGPGVVDEPPPGTDPQPGGGTLP